MSLPKDPCLPFCRPEKPCNEAADCPYGAAANSTIVFDSGYHLASTSACQSARSCCICRQSAVDAPRRQRSRRILRALKPSCFAGKKPDKAGSRSATAAGHTSRHLELGGNLLSIREPEHGRCFCCPCVNKLYQRQARAASDSAGLTSRSRPMVEIPQTSSVLSSWDGNGNVSSSSTTFSVMVILSAFAVCFTIVGFVLFYFLHRQSRN